MNMGGSRSSGELQGRTGNQTVERVLNTEQKVYNKNFYDAMEVLNKIDDNANNNNYTPSTADIDKINSALGKIQDSFSETYNHPNGGEYQYNIESMINDMPNDVNEFKDSSGTDLKDDVTYVMDQMSRADDKLGM